MSAFANFADEFYNLSATNSVRHAAAGMGGDTPEKKQQDWGVFDYATDMALGVPRGVLSAASDMVNLAGLPFGYEVENRFGLMADSESVAGGITEGIANFMTGMIPGGLVAGGLSKVAKGYKMVKAIDTAAEIAKASGNLTKYNAIRGAQALVKGSVAGAVADFVAFDGHEERLSNLLRDHAGLSDPLTAYLAADKNDSEIAGRFKNALEGLAIGGLTEGLFNAFRMYKAGFTVKSAGGSADAVDAAMNAEAHQIRLEQRDQIKTSFNLTDEEADVTNMLIDRMGLDRSKLKVVSGQEAQQAYDMASGALEQRKKFDPVAALPQDAQELKNLLDPEEWASIKSQGTLDSLVGLYKRFDVELMPLLRAAAEAGSPVHGGYEEGAAIMRKLVGDTRAELFANFSAATSPQNKVAAHTRLGVGITADVIDRIRAGNIAEMGLDEMRTIVDSVGTRLKAKGMVEDYAKRSLGIANDLLGRLRTLQEANPSASMDELLNTVDATGLYKNMAGTGMEKGAGKVPGFAEGSAGRLNKVVLDTYMARLVPDDLFPNLAASELMDAKKEWLGKAANYTAFSATVRKLSTELGIMPGHAQERIWGAVYVIGALKKEGMNPEAVYKNLSKEDMLASWDLLSILQKPEVTNELRRLGADEGSLADLAGLAADVRQRVRPNLNTPIRVSDPAALEELARRVPKFSGSSGTEVTAARAARGATLLNQEAAVSRADLWKVPEQAFSSADTSINASKLPTGFTKVEQAGGWKPGTVNVDIGGGRFDNAVEKLSTLGVDSKVFDPFNRSAEHNNAVSAAVAGGKADTATIFNVLNVIKEPENRLRVLQQAEDALKPGGKLYIQVYEGDASGVARATGGNKFQLNQKLKDYLPEVQKVFPEARVEKGLIVAEKSTSVLRQGEGSVRGFAAFAEDGKAVIGGLKNPDVGTAVHEIAHVGRRQLFDRAVPQEARMGISDADIGVMEKWAGVTDGTWTRPAEEKFANGFMKYLRDGEAPEGLLGIFSKLADWMRNIYRDIKGSELDIQISPEVKEVFDKLVSRGPGYERAVSTTATTAAVGARGAGRGPTLLEQAATSPDLGKPGGVPNAPINLTNFSTADDVNRAVDDFIKQEPLVSTLADVPPEALSQVAKEAQDNFDAISRISGEKDPLDFQRYLSTDGFSAYDLSQASRQLQGLRKFAASVSSRMLELSTKGSAASQEDIYEFLAARTASNAAIQSIKERQREVARMLGAMRINPTPEKISMLPPLPKAGEVKPTVAAAATSPAAVPSPGALPTSAAAVAPSPAAINPLMDEAMRARVIQQEIERAGGEDAVKAQMAKFAAAAASGGEEAVMKLARGYRSGNALVEYWMNSILSGPVTHAVNISANLLTALYLPMERALGATLRGDMKGANAALRQYVHMGQQFGDAMRLAYTALKMDANILESVGTAEKDVMGRAISARGFGMADDSTGGKAVNWLGNLLNLPTRFLTAEDEFFKQLNYRSSFLTELHMEGMNRFKGNPQAAAKWAQETFDRALQDGQAYAESTVLKRAYAEADKAISAGTIKAPEKIDFVAKYMADSKNWDPELGVLSDRAMSQARYATFSTPLTNDPNAMLTTRLASRIQAAANEHPLIRFALPFIRTPTNLLNFTLDRTFVVNLPASRQAFGEMSAALMSKNPHVKNDAMGRLAFSAAAAFTVGTAAFSGVITGGGPKNKNERDMKMQTGWQPYSIRIGDKYVSYRREDPFASIIGLVADVVEGYQYADEKGAVGLDKALNTIVLAISRNITNKTYLTGITNISNAISNPEQFGQTLVNQYVSSLVPFSSALSQSISTVADDPVMRDTRTMLDAIRAKIPFLAEQVAPKRNILGEAVTRPSSVGPDMFSPLTYTEVKDDKILQEFNLLGHGFTPPKEQRGAIDLTTFSTRSGQQAYDRWLELHGTVRVGGRTLREALLREINSRGYQRLSPASTEDYDSPRIRQLREVIATYREAAYRQLLREAPELDRASRLDFANKQALRMGRSAQELFDLGNR